MTSLRAVDTGLSSSVTDAAARVFAASLMATGAHVEAADRRKIAEEDTEAFFAKLTEMNR